MGGVNGAKSLQYDALFTFLPHAKPRDTSHPPIGGLKAQCCIHHSAISAISKFKLQELLLS